MASINCRTCGYHQSERVPAKLVGKNVKCPQCRRAVTVQASESQAPIDFPMADDGSSAATPKSSKTTPTPRTQSNIFQPASISLSLPVRSEANTKPIPSQQIVPGKMLSISGNVLPRRIGPWNVLIVLVTAAVMFVVGALSSPHIFPAISRVVEHQEPEAAAPKQLAAVVADQGLEELRAYLKENTNTGEWEEVRFWPAFSLATPSHSNALLSAGLSLSQNTRFDDSYPDAMRLEATARANVNIRFMRLKYRTQNGFGTVVLTDTIFAINENNVAPLNSSEERIMQCAWDDLQRAEAGVVLPDAPVPWADHDAVLGSESPAAKDLARRLRNDANQPNDPQP